MGLPQQAVTLTPEQIAALNQKLSTMRHDINNNLQMVIVAAELARLKPEMAAQLAGGLLEQPGKISEKIREFSAEFERAFGITKP